MGYSDLILADAPIAWWRLDTAADPTPDESGNGHTATYVPFGGAPAQYGQTPLAGDGHSVNLVAGSRFVGDDSITIGEAFSMEAWFRFQRQLTPDDYHAIVSLDDTSGPGIVFESPDLIEPARLEFWGEGTLLFHAPITALDDTQKHHIVVTKDGLGNASAKLYIDGNEIAITLDADDPSSYVGAVAIGTSFSSALNLQVDEVAIYDVALTPEQVDAHFLSGQVVVLSPSLLGAAYELTQQPLVEVRIDGVLVLPSVMFGNPNFPTDGIPAVISVRGDEGTIGLVASEDAPVPTCDIELTYIPRQYVRASLVTVDVGYAGEPLTRMFTGGIHAVGDENPDFLATQGFLNGVTFPDGTKISGTATETISIPMWPAIPDGQFIDFTIDNPFIWDNTKASEAIVRETAARARVPKHPTGSPLSQEIHCNGDLYGAFSQYKVPERDLSGMQVRAAILAALTDSGAADVNVAPVPDYELAPDGAKAARMAASQLLSYLMQIDGCRVQQLRNGTVLVSPIIARPSETAAFSYSTEDQTLARIVETTGELRVPFNPTIKPRTTGHFTIGFLDIDADFFVMRHRWEIGPGGAWSYVTLAGGDDFGTTVGANPNAIFTYSIIFELIGPTLYAIITFDASGSDDPDGPPLTGADIAWTDNQTPPYLSGTGFTKTVVIDPTDLVGDYIPQITVTDPTALTGVYAPIVPVPTAGAAQRLPAVGVANTTKASYSPDGEQTWNNQTLADCNVVALRPYDGVNLGHAIYSSGGAIDRTQDACASAVAEVLADVGSPFVDLAWDWRNTNVAWGLTLDARVYASIDQADTFGLYGGQTMTEALAASAPGTYLYKYLLGGRLWGWTGSAWVKINDAAYSSGTGGHLKEFGNDTYMLVSNGGGYAFGGKSMWRSRDGGQSFDLIYAATLPMGGSNYYGVVDYDITVDGRIRAVVGAPGLSTTADSFDDAPTIVIESTDGGDTWTTLHTLPASNYAPAGYSNSNGRPENITNSSDGTRIFVQCYVINGAGWVSRSFSDDSGATWTDTYGNLSGWVNAFSSTSPAEVHYQNDGSIVYVKGYTDPKIYRSITDGLTWVQVYDGNVNGFLVFGGMTWTDDSHGSAVFVSAAKNTSPRTRWLLRSDDYGETWDLVPNYPKDGQNAMGLAYDAPNAKIIDLSVAPYSASYDNVETITPLGTPTFADLINTGTPHTSFIDGMNNVCVAAVPTGGLVLIAGCLGLPAGYFGATPLFVFLGAYDSVAGYAYPLIAFDNNLTNDWGRIALGAELLTDIASALPAEGLVISSASATFAPELIIGLKNNGGLAPVYYTPDITDAANWRRAVGLPDQDVVVVLPNSPIAGKGNFKVVMADGSIYGATDGINFSLIRAAPIATDFLPTHALFISDVLTGIQGFQDVYMFASEDATGTGRLDKSIDGAVTLTETWPAGGAFPAWPAGAKPRHLSIGGAALPP